VRKSSSSPFTRVVRSSSHPQRASLASYTTSMEIRELASILWKSDIHNTAIHNLYRPIQLVDSNNHLGVEPLSKTKAHGKHGAFVGELDYRDMGRSTSSFSIASARSSSARRVWGLRPPLIQNSSDAAQSFGEPVSTPPIVIPSCVIRTITSPSFCTRTLRARVGCISAIRSTGFLFTEHLLLQVKIVLP
jgi:hypothetical protein